MERGTFVDLRSRPAKPARSGSMDREQWDRHYGGDELVWTSAPNRFLVSEVAALPPGRAVDLACGEGRNAIWLAERGWTVTGVDFSPVGLAKAQRLADSRQVHARWVESAIQEWSAPARRIRSGGRLLSAASPARTVSRTGHGRGGGCSWWNPARRRPRSRQFDQRVRWAARRHRSLRRGGRDRCGRRRWARCGTCRTGGPPG